MSFHSGVGGGRLAPLFLNFLYPPCNAHPVKTHMTGKCACMQSFSMTYVTQYFFLLNQKINSQGSYVHANVSFKIGYYLQRKRVVRGKGGGLWHGSRAEKNRGSRIHIICKSHTYKVTLDRPLELQPLDHGSRRIFKFPIFAFHRK